MYRSAIAERPRAATWEELGLVAQAITDHVLSEGTDIDHLGLPIPRELPLDDIAEAAARFGAEVGQAESEDRPVLAVMMDAGPPLPVDVRGMIDARLGEGGFEARTTDFQSLENLLNSRGLPTRRLTVPDGRQAFLLRLRRFTFARLIGGLLVPRTPPARAPRLKGRLGFRVFTATHGLRVRYAPASILGEGTVFGSPTSPVDGELLPGRYIFGAEGPNTPLVWDPGEYDVPPATEARLIVI